MHITAPLRKQIIQLLSPDESMPTYQLKECQRKIGGTNKGLFAIANAIEVVNSDDPSSVTFDQSSMRPHFFSCFETGKLEPELI